MNTRLEDIKNKFEEAVYYVAVQNSYGNLGKVINLQEKYGSIEKIDPFFDEIREQMIVLISLTDLELVFNIDEDEVREQVYSLNNEEIEENLTGTQVESLIGYYQNLIDELEEMIVEGEEYEI